jgi:hypothetical protein
MTIIIHQGRYVPDPLGAVRFAIPPVTNRDRASAAMMAQLRKNLAKLKRMGFSTVTRAKVRQRWNRLVAGEAHELCDRQLTPKRHRARALALVHRSNAIVKWANELLMDEIYDCLEGRPRSVMEGQCGYCGDILMLDLDGLLPMHSIVGFSGLATMCPHTGARPMYGDRR